MVEAEKEREAVKRAVLDYVEGAYDVDPALIRRSVRPRSAKLGFTQENGQYVEHQVEGKIRFYGWSTDRPESARVFAEGEHCVAIQHRLNVIRDAPEILNVCVKFDLASINRGPLARGALTGKYDPDAQFPDQDLRHREEFRENWLVPATEALEKIGSILTGEGRTLAQGALAWIWAHSARTIPIPGIRTAAQAEENAKAMAFGPLTAGQMAEVDRLLGR
jgi:aryl-alcohol dehydrogenase-like predicted oxidoreductase